MATFAEHWQLSPFDTLRLPIARRKRLLRWKERHANLVAQQARSRTEESSGTFTAEDINYIWGSDSGEEF